MLPVVIQSMGIVELQYDFVLNPTLADVDITLAVNRIDKCSDDLIGKGALDYSNLAGYLQSSGEVRVRGGTIPEYRGKGVRGYGQCPTLIPFPLSLSPHVVSSPSIHGLCSSSCSHVFPASQ